MKKNERNLWVKGMWAILLILIMVSSCKKITFRETTTDAVNITGYLEQHPDKYSKLVDILYRSKTAGYLGAYGTYTLFAPNNTAVDAWIQSQGKAGIEDFSEEALSDFVRYHVVRDTVGTINFTDGKIKTTTLFGEYLYTDIVDAGYRINKISNIIESNIPCQNGVVHAIDKVLTPPALSLAETVDSNPNYSIFSEALKATGFYDTLYYERGMPSAPGKRFRTVIVQSNKVFNDNNIFSFEDLKEKYSQTGNPKNHADSLWLFVAYHLSDNANFLEDIITMSTIYTLAPKEIATTKLSNTKVLLNDDEFNGVYEPGAELIRANSDVIASNGVLHEVAQSIGIKVRVQVPIYYDLASSPELRAALGGVYGRSWMALVANGNPIASSFAFDKYDYITIANNTYNFSPTSAADARPYANGDNLTLSVGAAATSNRIKYFEFKTPYLVKGRYKVWVCYAQNNNGPTTQVVFNPGKSDEQILPNVVFFNQSLTASGLTTTTIGQANADNLMLGQGYKRYLATTAETNANGVVGVKGISGTRSDINVSRLVGIIEVGTTDRHTIRFSAIAGPFQNNNTFLDMIHFIPADDVEQNYPRFHPTPGELFYRPQ